MTPAKLTLTPFTEGDTWEGIPSLTIRVNGAAPAADITSVTMRFKKADRVPGTEVQLSSATPAQITITNANNWQIAIPPQIVPGLISGKWTWRLRVTDATGVISTYLADELTVLETV